MTNVHIFIPCFMDQLFPGTALNMVKVLKRLDCEVVYNSNQTCCGQPAYNAGYRNESKEVCQKFLQDFASASIIVTPSASCAGFLHNYYPQMFDNSSLHNEAKKLKTKVVEFTDFLVNHLKVTDLGAVLNKKATYHDSCAALREYQLEKTTPRVLLEYVKGLELVEMKDTDVCCGFGGTFAVKHEGISGAMADQKVANAKSVDAELIISTDISCLMHINGYAQKNEKLISTMHIADVLASGW
jgi:L-lactate dehydrogenase complex protein LldE